MAEREQFLRHLKRHGPCSIQDLMAALGLSENAVRHHLKNLEREGYLKTTQRREGVGRPAKHYELTLAAEGLFPKRYHDLLDAVLEQAAKQGELENLLSSLAKSLAEQVKPALLGLEPAARLNKLMERLDYGDMLGHLATTEAGWEFKAYNCVYRDTGCKFEAVCNLLPKLIKQATHLPAERVICQRDGKRYCHFAGSYLEE